jgi:hypothetical protein
MNQFVVGSDEYIQYIELTGDVMQFTVVFDMLSNLGDGSFSIRYHPAAHWMQGDKGLPVKIKSSPIYESGGLKPLLEFAKLDEDTLNSNKVVIVVHQSGSGDSECLENLIRDFRKENFEPIILRID